ncbi:hypothetical protein PM082_024784 [Marasmius tenuissimus]|nr:hypothetical protein PM082_024784 [Marasmius tenuissimus]
MTGIPMDVHQPTTMSQIFVSTICLDYPRSCSLILAAPVAGTCVLFLCYGVYLVLFAVCISVLVRQRSGRLHIHCFLVTALFVLATCTVVLNTTNTVLEHDAMNVLLNLPRISLQQSSKVNLEQQMGPQRLSPDDMLKIPTFGLSRSLFITTQLMTVTSNLISDIILVRPPQFIGFSPINSDVSEDLEMFSHLAKSALRRVTSRSSMSC